jgi:hypothetical protein
MVINKFFSNTNSTLFNNIALTVLLITLLSMSIYYIIYQATNKKRRDNYMANTLEDVDMNISNISITDASKKHNLRDYYIMSSYNSCCNGNFKDGYVSLKALMNVINIGARVLDFEIYNIDENPVVACSNSDSYNYKGTYNSIPFADVIQTIRNNAFRSTDPLIIHLRLKTNSTKVCDKVGKIIANDLDRWRLDNKYDYEYSNSEGKLLSLMNEPLLNFRGKVIIMTDRSNTSFIGTSLDEVTNICSNTLFCQQLRNYDVVYTPDFNELIDHNKKNTTISMCDLKQASANNMDSSIHMKFGCQMICMNFQSVDDNLIFYLEQFNEVGSSFILKPSQLRYIPVTSKQPTPQNPELSYAPRTIEKPYFKHTI